MQRTHARGLPKSAFCVKGRHCALKRILKMKDFQIPGSSSTGDSISEELTEYEVHRKLEGTN